MSAKNPMKQTLKKMNTLFSKLSWLYLIIVCLLVLIIIQWYTNSTRPQLSTTPQSNQITQMENQLHKHQQLIESLQKEVDALKNKE